MIGKNKSQTTTTILASATMLMLALSLNSYVIPVYADIQDDILAKVIDVEERLDGNQTSLVTQINSTTTSTSDQISSIVIPTLSSIQNTLSQILTSIQSLSFGVSSIQNDVQNINGNVTQVIALKTISTGSNVTVGTPNEQRTVTLSSNEFPVVVRTVYFNADTGSGSTDLSQGERIRYDSLRVNDGLVNDPVQLQLMLAGSNSQDTEQRILQVEASNAQLQRLFPFGIDGNMTMGIELDSNAAAAENNGFEFEIIAIVEAPANAEVSIDIE